VRHARWRARTPAARRPRAPGRGLRQPLTRHLRRPQAYEPKEVIDHRQREVHRRRRPPPLQLQEPLEVPDRVVPCERVGKRIARGRIGAEPRDEAHDLPRVTPGGCAPTTAGARARPDSARPARVARPPPTRPPGSNGTGTYAKPPVRVRVAVAGCRRRGRGAG
jgi:hypothetical protein